MFATLTYQLDGAVAEITLARPEMLNSFDNDSGPELWAALLKARDDDAVKVILLTARGRIFSAGANLKKVADQLAADPARGARPFFEEHVDTLHRIALTMRQVPKPIICGLNGPVAGGGLGWVLGSDIIIASDQAAIDPAYIRVGLAPDGGSTYLLPRAVGYWKAAELMFTGTALTAAQAKELGLVSRVVAPDEVLPTARKLARHIAAQSGPALALTKKLLTASLENDQPTQMELEREAICRSSATPEFEAGLKAFFAKTKS